MEMPRILSRWIIPLLLAAGAASALYAYRDAAPLLGQAPPNGMPCGSTFSCTSYATYCYSHQCTNGACQYQYLCDTANPMCVPSSMGPGSNGQGKCCPSGTTGLDGTGACCDAPAMDSNGVCCPMALFSKANISGSQCCTTAANAA